jgi:hypothetical protein
MLDILGIQKRFGTPEKKPNKKPQWTSTIAETSMKVFSSFSRLEKFLVVKFYKH